MNQLLWILLALQLRLMMAEDVPYEPYHVKTKSILVFNRPAGDMEEYAYFGFSSGSYNSKNASVVVSAPRADKVGKLFECHVNDLSCSAITIDPLLNSTAIDVAIAHKDHHLWLGATVKGTDSLLLACAPLSVQRAKCAKTGSNYATYGECFQYLPEAEDFQLKKLDQISDSARAKKNLSIENCMDSFGWSADISYSRKKVVVGGPAMATGRAMIYASTDSMPVQIQDCDYLKDTAKVSYNFGYSVAYGNFMNEALVEFTAISTPYGEKGVGKVLLHPSVNLQESQVLDPDNQVGSLFGGSLCAAKLNPTSNRAHLLVGAPAFAVKDTTERKLAYNCGAVYIFASFGRAKKLVKLNSIKGTHDGAFFGSAIGNVGDLDGDKSEDVAIAAPFEDDGHGAVYIYLGSDLIRQNQPIHYKQKIQPEAYRAFGLSISTLKDYDNNGCNELVIGAPGSMQGGNDQVAVIRCFACINVKMLRISFPDLKKREDVAFFDFKSCMEVTFPEKNNVSTNISMTVQIVHPTASLAQENNTLAHYIIPISKDKEIKTKICQSIRVLTPEIGEYDTMIGFNVMVNLTDSPLDKEEFDPSDVVLCSGSELKVKDDVFAGNCTSDKCEPILKAKLISEFFYKESYVIGSTELESFSVEVNNTGDVAYSTCVRIRVLGAPVMRVPQKCGYDCDGRTNCQLVLCRPASLVVTNSIWKTEDILLGMSSLKSTDEVVTVNVEVFDHCSDENATSSDNGEVPLISFYDGVVLDGKANPDSIVSITRNEATNQGKHIEHLYRVTNTGPTNIVEITYKLSIQNTDYFEYSAPTVNKGLQQLDCNQIVDNVGEMKIAVCQIKELHKLETVVFTLPIDLLAGKMDLILKGQNMTVYSQLDLLINSTTGVKWSASENVTTTLTLYDPKVAWWIILLAIILGIILIALLFYLLYKAGCLQRQNKEKLQELKREVRRQSIRRSVRERDSMRSNSRKESSDDTALVCENELKNGENDIDILEVRNEGFLGEQRHGKTVAAVHKEPLQTDTKNTNL